MLPDQNFLIWQFWFPNFGIFLVLSKFKKYKLFIKINDRNLIKRENFKPYLLLTNKYSILVFLLEDVFIYQHCYMCIQCLKKKDSLCFELIVYCIQLLAYFSKEAMLFVCQYVPHYQGRREGVTFVAFVTGPSIEKGRPSGLKYHITCPIVRSLPTEHLT